MGPSGGMGHSHGVAGMLSSHYTPYTFLDVPASDSLRDTLVPWKEIF